MISLSDPSLPLDRTLLEARGGFAWWYLDLVDAHGDGLVLIWSFGLPFLPGVTHAARTGAPQRPADRPSLNVAVYQGGRCTFYLLQEYAPEDAEWTPGTERCRFGTSTLTSSSDGTVCKVDANLRCPLPGTNRWLEAEIHAEGPAVHHDAASPGDHHWTPLLTAARGEATLRVGDEPIAVLEGRVYHDRNGSRLPLDGLGIAHWVWGRAAVGDAERVWYLLWPEGGGDPLAMGLEIGPDGATRGPIPLTVALEGDRRARYGVRYPRVVTLNRDGAPWLEIEHAAPVEDGPFYLRLPLRARAGDAEGPGWGEVVVPDRVDRPWMQPFVAMRVHRPHGGSSIFAPLFLGTARGRVARLFGMGR